MDGLKKLFRVKRILAMVLAVTLAVTSAPVTAQAAPGDIPEQTEVNVEDISEDISLEETEREPAEEPAAENEDAGTVIPEISETAPTQEDAQVQADTAAAPKAEIEINSGWGGSYDPDKQSWTVKTTYDDKKENPFKDIVNSLKYYDDANSLTYYVEVTVTGDSEGEYDESVLKNRLAYTWQQKGSDGNYAPMSGASAPVNAGEYRLVISIDPQIIAAESKYIDFVIEKAKLYITVDNTKLPKAFAGKKVSEVQDSYAEAVQVALNSENGSTDDGRYLQFVTAIDKTTVKVSDPLGDVLPETDVLKKGSDYLVEIAPELKAEYQANYELTPYAENIPITELVEVELKTESDLEPGKDITYLYGKDEVKAPIATDAPADKKVAVKIIVKDEKDEATGEDKELQPVLDGDQKNITGVWLDANKIELEEGKVPKDAGVYYYKLTYISDGVYGVDPDAEDCLVKVVVEPAKLVVRPTLADDKKNPQQGTSVSDLLKDVEYKLIERDDDGKYTTKEFSIPAEEKDTFWGVSYNQPDKPQYYEPVFEVQKRTTKTTTYTDPTKKAETVEGSWTKVMTTTLIEASGETVVKEESDKDQTVTKNVEYRVIFAGQKGLYKNGIVTESFDINKQIDVNSADKNYDVDVTKNVLEDAANVVAITVESSTEVKIVTKDIEDIVKNNCKENNNKDIELKDGVYTKEYDEKAPFNDRSEYKKAKTDNADADKVGTFTYGWYRYTMELKLDDKGEVVKDADGNPVEEPKCDEEHPVATLNDYNLKTLANAGEYCLKIEYNDSTNTYWAEPAYLFFKIDGKLVKVVPKEGQKPKAYTGKCIRDFVNEINKNETIEYSIFEKDENGTDLTETLKQLDQEINTANKYAHLYTINWVVLQGDNTDSKKAKYTKVDTESEDYWDTFIEGVPYKLGAELRFAEFSNEKYGKYEKNYTNEYERDKDDPIQQHNWCYNPLDIELGIMSDVALIVELHPEKLDALEADYNGEEQFKVEDLIAAGYITVAAENDPDTALAIGSGEGQVALDFEWSGTALGEKNGNPVNVGRYYLTVSYPGDDKYKDGIWNSWYSSYRSDFEINPRELKIQAKAALENAEIMAGWDMSDIGVKNRLIDKENLTVTGYIDADKEAFADKDGTGLVKDAPAFKNRTFEMTVKEKGERYSYSGYLRYGKEYVAAVSKLTIGNAKALKDELARNYKITAEDITIAVGKRGNSTVKDALHSHSDDVQSAGSVATHVRASYEDNKVTVTPASGICYFYDNTWLKIPEEKFVPGNYLIFDIVAPTEFDANGSGNDGNYSDAFKNFVYQNSIEGTGKGYVLTDYVDKSNGTIRVAFPVTKEDKADARTFTILWEKLDGVNYTENYTVDMSKAQLEDDLRTAVAPKTLAFNGVNTKMTVGETQQLDVKMTKVLNSDVVFLNYKVAAGSEKYASVTPETGVVTALAKGKATIEVYPVRRNNKGEVEPITEFKKTVKTTITINDVTAPKINSVYAYDDNFDLKYTQPADGYRREIYVLEGKNKKANDFENLIRDVQSKGKNKLDEAFVKWFYVTPDDEIDSYVYDKKTKAVTMNVGSIKPAKEYTVYVRNVSGVRTLDDGSLATASAQGTVKSFKATKVQLHGIRLDYSTADEQAKRTPADDKINKTGIDEIDLSKGFVQLKAMGEFEMQSGNENADYGEDREWKVLPLDKKDANYETQKLTFYAVESPYGYTKEQIAQYKLTDYKTLIGNHYYKASSIAKIDKKGKLSLKGVGVVYIIAYDAVSKEITPADYDHSNVDDSLEVSKASWQYALRITSPITSIKAKDATLKVGSGVYIRPNITFFNGNKKLNDINSSLTVKNTDNSEDVTVSGNTIIAKEPNKQVNMTVCLSNDPTVETTLKVKTKPMDPVKSLKAVDVIDNSAKITFTHTGNYVNQFKIDLLDNRNRLIRSHIEDTEDEDLSVVWDKSDTKKGVYFYEYTLTGLKRQSVYNVVVTPIFGEQTAKEVKTKFTTTNIPAYGNISVGKDEDGNLVEGGMPISIESLDGRTLDEIGYLTSGNSYTLIADANDAARIRKSDTLTWKSTNSKVASVKANAGTFTATLKASSVGYTYIEVTSKITKKVIARWIVRVKSVSNGGKGAYGDTEPIDIAWDPAYDQGIEVLTEKNPVRFATPMGGYDYRWISFTAPADGYYSFSGFGASISGYYYKTDFPEEYDGGKKEELKKEFIDKSFAILDEGKTIYFKVAGTDKGGTAVITVSAQKYGKLTASESVSVAGLSQVTFTAPEDNYYTFYASESGKSASSNKKYISFATEESGVTDSASVGLKKDEKVTLYGFSSGNYSISVKGRTYTALSSDGKVSTGSLAAKEGSVTDKWFAFEAKAAGEYTFTVAPDKAGAMEARYYTDLTRFKNYYDALAFDVTTTDGKDTLSITRTLNEGDKIAICVSATSEEAVTADVSVSQPKTAVVSLAAATGELTVEENKPVWVSFKVPEAGKEYCFNYAVETGKNVTRTYYQNDVTSDKGVSQDRFTSTKDDKTIYIKLMTDDTSAKVTVSVKETKADAITTAQGASFEVKSGSKQFYTFTAPVTGLYAFKATLAEASKDKNVSIGKVTKATQNLTPSELEEQVSNDYGVQKLLTGEKLILAVTTTEADAVKGDVKVTAVPVETLEAKEYTLAANERKWFKFTPSAAGKYSIGYTSAGGSAVVYYSATLSAETTVLTPVYNDFGAGDVMYVKAVNGDAETKLTFTITSTDAKPLPADGKITVKKDEEVTYKYTVTQTGMYKLTYTANVEGANPTVSRSGPKIVSGREIECPTIGQVIEFTVSVAKDAVVTLNMERIVPSTTLEATVAKDDGVQWFEYTAPATGRYTVALTDDAGKTITSGVTATYRTEKITGTEKDFYNPTIIWIKKDAKWYFRVQNDGTADQKVKIAFTKITASEKLEVGAEPKSVTFAEGEEKWYSLTIDETTKYSFTVENAKLGLYKDGEPNYYEPISSSSQIDLNKGTYLVKAEKNGEAADAASKIGVKKETFLTFDDKGEVSIHLKSGYQFIKFTPSKTAYYAFRLKEVPEDVTYVYVSGAGVNLNKEKTYDYTTSKLTMAESQEISVYFNLAENASDTKSVKLSVQEIKPAELESGSELSVTVAKGEMSFFTFTAPEAGYYDFAEDSKDVAVKYVSRDDNDYLPSVSTSASVLPTRIYMYKGRKATFGVCYDDLKTDATVQEVPESATFKVTAKQFEIPELKSESELSVTVKKGEMSYFTFTAPEAGYYEFADDSEDVRVRYEYNRYDNLPSAYPYSSSLPVSISIQEGWRVTFGVFYNDMKDGVTAEVPESATFKVTVKKDTSYTLEELSPDEVKPVKFSEGETEKWYSFKPEISGEYQWKFTEAGDGYINVYFSTDGEDWDYRKVDFVSEENDFSYEMWNGTTYIIKITSDAQPSFNMEVSWQPPVDIRLAEYINIGDIKDVTVDEDMYALFAFTAPKNGDYTFYSTGSGADPVATLYGSNLNWMDSGDDEMGYPNFGITKELLRGETYYLKVNEISGGSLKNFSLYVIEGKMDFPEDED